MQEPAGASPPPVPPDEQNKPPSCKTPPTASAGSEELLESTCVRPCPPLVVAPGTHQTLGRGRKESEGSRSRDPEPAQLSHPPRGPAGSSGAPKKLFCSHLFKRRAAGWLT